MSRTMIIGWSIVVGLLLLVNLGLADDAGRLVVPDEREQRSGHNAHSDPWAKDYKPKGAATAAPEEVYYAGCNEARAAGAAPIYEGQPGYRPEMDGDGDGIACEPYHGN